MIALPTIGVGIGLVLISFFATSNAGKCFEVKSTDASLFPGNDGIVFNFFAADTDLIFDGTTPLAVTVDHYRNGALINESIAVNMVNSTTYSPSVGDSYGRKNIWPPDFEPGQFETGDFLCLFSGVMMTPIPANSTGVGSSACTGTVSGVSDATVSGLAECKQKCLANSDCNTINYCNDATLCPSYSSMLPYCTFKKCTGDDYMLSSTYGIFDIYTKMNESCYDGVQNQMEEDVDCGGPYCPICETCMDGMQNQDEEDIDCGGSNCLPCLPEDTCEDGILSGDEEDVDCGGSCPPCGGDKPAWYPGKYKLCRNARRKGKCDDPKIKAHCQRACRSFKDNDRYGKEKCWALRWHCAKSLHVKKHCGKTCKTMSLNPEQ